MGTFINNIGNTDIPEDKWEEFEEHITKIFNIGGSMSVSIVQIFDKTIHLIEPPKKVTIKDAYDEEYTLIRAGFNYFEEDTWESAGYNVNKHFVYSGKVGYKHHFYMMLAAHLLQEIYSGENCLTSAFNNTYKTVAWLNYLFDENYNLPMREDFFHIYKILKDYERYIQEQDVSYIMNNVVEYTPCGRSFLHESFYKLIEEFAKGMTCDELLNFIYDLKFNSSTLEFFKKLIKEDENLLMRFSHLFKKHSPIKQIKRICQICNNRYLRGKNLKIGDKKHGNQKIPINTLDILPHFLFCIISSKIYNIPKEEIAECIKINLLPDISSIFSFKLNIGKEVLNEYGKVTTEDFFNVTPDDRLYWWNEDFVLSEECKQWFQSLKQKYNTKVIEEKNNYTLSVMEFFKYFISVISKHENLFLSVPMFKATFYEILNNSEDAHYRAMVSLIADFEDDINPELSHKELKKEHDTIKRYFALLANPQLRLRILDI